MIAHSEVILCRISDFDAVCLDDVQVHVLTTLVKAFLREMPEPLITFDLYENFLNVSGMHVKSEF